MTFKKKLYEQFSHPRLCELSFFYTSGPLHRLSAAPAGGTPLLLLASDFGSDVILSGNPSLTLQVWVNLLLSGTGPSCHRQLYCDGPFTVVTPKDDPLHLGQALALFKSTLAQ